jgi:hypothetical protein
VFGLTLAPGGAGVFGANNSAGPGRGVQGNGPEAGVGGFSEKGVGVLAQSNAGIGIRAAGGAQAGIFDGPVTINGNLTMGNGGDVILADCAEEFKFVASLSIVDPGSVMVLDENGDVRPCSLAYDKRVVGVVSGAGPFRPAIVLDRVSSATDRVPIALIGKVCCKVDATIAPVEVGDLLTTSPTCGHAMKASNPQQAFGAVVGKALRPLEAGQGLIPILIALQ